MTEGIFLATAMPDPEWWEALWPRPSEVLAGLDIEPGMEVVDLCCGDGLFTASLSGMARRVVAIDLDPKILELARARQPAAKASEPSGCAARYSSHTQQQHHPGALGLSVDRWPSGSGRRTRLCGGGG